MTPCISVHLEHTGRKPFFAVQHFSSDVFFLSISVSFAIGDRRVRRLDLGCTVFFSFLLLTVSGNNLVLFSVLCVVYVRVYVNFLEPAWTACFVYLLANGIGYAMQVIIVFIFTTYYYPGL